LLGVATKDRGKALIKLFEKETDPYVLTRLAYTLNEVTRRKQNLSGDGPLLTSKPGERREFTKRWRDALKR
jgi:hypothetical protein